MSKMNGEAMSVWDEEINKKGYKCTKGFVLLILNPGRVWLLLLQNEKSSLVHPNPLRLVLRSEKPVSFL